MKTLIRKSMLAALAAVTMGAGVMATAAEAQPVWRHGPGGYHGGWHRGGGRWVGGAWLPFAIGGLAIGAMAGSACYQLQPMYDPWGRYVGRQWVWVC